ncbi:unnamed protein product [Thlaspi arvense]|uniref:PUM-HD domain-containing protein n=1 Tax=Thlaspi arvense TaxID=13288 RepID=A0AAU9STV1_THLAR|nr:unnamed protein product [Thlaspi arvense]
MYGECLFGKGVGKALTLLLSYDVYGSFVIQRVLQLNDVRCTYNIAVSLRGNCVELAFQKYGRYIVEKLLETEESRVEVVTELFWCEGHRLMRLARSEQGLENEPDDPAPSDNLNEVGKFMYGS